MRRCTDALPSVVIDPVATDVTNLNIQMTSETSLTLTWSGAGGIVSPTYTIAYTTGLTAPADCTLGTTISGITLTSRVITGLEFGTSYSFRVCADDNGSLTTGIVDTESTDTVQRIFASSTRYNGDFSGINGADAECNNEAASAGLSGTWKSLLSVSWKDVNARVSITKKIYNYRPIGSGGPQLIASSAADLWDGTLSNAIAYSQDGNLHNDMVWTGSTAIGEADGSAMCADWTLNTGQSSYTGYSNETGFRWMHDSNENCGMMASIYCINGQ